MSFRSFRRFSETTCRLQAAKLLLYRLKDRMDLRGDDKVFRDAHIKYMLEHPEYLERFLYSGDVENIRYRNHKRNKQGKLISVECYELGER